MDAGDAPVNAALFKLAQGAIEAHYRSTNPKLLPIGGWVGGCCMNGRGRLLVVLGWLLVSDSDSASVSYHHHTNHFTSVEGMLKEQAVAVLGGSR